MNQNGFRLVLREVLDLDQLDKQLVRPEQMCWRVVEEDVDAQREVLGRSVNGKENRNVAFKTTHMGAIVTGITPVLAQFSLGPEIPGAQPNSLGWEIKNLGRWDGNWEDF